VAFAVADRSRDIADLARVSLPHVLVGVIAHELAHLLMPRRGHSPSGILHARWRPDEFRVLPRHPFTGEEATEIRRSVAAMSGTAAHADN
jgi:predicted SprT family Zn-dependent metalloprotease